MATDASEVRRFAEWLSKASTAARELMAFRRRRPATPEAAWWTKRSRAVFKCSIAAGEVMRLAALVADEVVAPDGADTSAWLAGLVKHARLLKCADVFVNAPGARWQAACLGLCEAAEHLERLEWVRSGKGDETERARCGNVPDQLVTMLQMASAVNKSKAAIEKIKPKLPPPRVKGGSGKASEWLWSDVRPVLAEHFSRPALPEFWPADRYRRR